MYIVKPRWSFKAQGYDFDKEKFYILPDIYYAMFELDALTNHKVVAFSNALSFYDIIPYIAVIKNSIKNIKHLILVRTGGYGDVIALSSILKYCYERLNIQKISFVTGKKDILKYLFVSDDDYKNRFFAYSLFDNIEKILNVRSFLSIVKILEYCLSNNVCGLIYEGIIETEKKKNWYDLFFETLGEKNVDNSYKKPFLNEKVVKRSIFVDMIKEYFGKDDYVLLQLTSTSYVRRYKLKTILNFFMNETDENVVLIARNLLDSDINVLEKYLTNSKFRKRIFIVPFTFSIDDFVSIIYYAKDCVCVDTMVYHLRAGWNKPCFVIFTSFHPDLRSKYYPKCINSVYLESSCPFQPCVHHTKVSTEKCPFYDTRKKDDNLKKKYGFYPEEDIYPYCVIDTEKLILRKLRDYYNA